MFTYLHCYTDETWDAMVKAGFINEHSGIRFMQSITVPHDREFNVMAAAGGKLYNYLNDTKCPFYIDRLQGGCYIENYPYDWDLVSEYKKMLGDNFWGFQMHEWMSNINSDLGKLADCKDYTEKGITDHIKAKFPYPYLFLEAMTADEFAKLGRPKTWEEFTAGAEKMFKDRQKRTDGYLLTCDSGYLALPLEIHNGLRRTMPEIGGQTADTRIQLAFARGMAKGSGIKFGAYYEPWGGKPFGACCYADDEDINEWGINNKNFPFHTDGKNGGSSRSLQRRIHFYAYMAGAEFMSEEWGLCNTFNNWQDFEITEYGKIKLDFIKFTEKYPDIGHLITPVAIVLSSELPALDLWNDPDCLFHFPLQGKMKDILRATNSAVDSIMKSSYDAVGDETNIIRNCKIPDAVDIITEEFLKDGTYEYLVDATCDSTLKAKYGDKVITPEEVPEVLYKLLPCKVEGKVMSQITETDDGKYYLALYNNSGITRSVADGERVNHEADTVVKVSIKNNRELTHLEGNSKIEKTADGEYMITVSAGDLFFGRF